jgi:hypothetical protein
MVTAELAACLPVLVLIVSVALTAVSAAAARARLQDAAREAARAAARGDDAGARRLAGHLAPGSALVLRERAGMVVAVVSGRLRPFGSWLPGLAMSERAFAAVEPRAGAP